jgi:pyruvate-formate lyase-activating enzyme
MLQSKNWTTLVCTNLTLDKKTCRNILSYIQQLLVDIKCDFKTS